MNSATKGHLLWYTGRLAVVGLPHPGTHFESLSLTAGKTAPDRRVIRHQSGVSFAELAPLFILRPFSGSAALSLLGDVLTTYGPDTFTGVAASIMLGSTETIFYTIALYFGTVGIRRTRAALPAALISSVIGTAAAIVLAQGLFA